MLTVFVALLIAWAVLFALFLAWAVLSALVLICASDIYSPEDD